MNRVQLKAYLELYRDLGISEIYLRPAQPQASLNESAIESAPAVCLPSPTGDCLPEVEPNRSPAPAILAPLSVLPDLAPEGDTLETICNDIGDCTRCRLSEARNKIVFGSGDPNSKIVFVGEGPGADEDEQGVPFVGRAGQLLTQMIDNTAAKEGFPIRRQDVYICNVVKCRPPENRTPLPDEMQTCGQFLYRQLMTIKPKAICALGATATKALLNTKEGITKSRGKWHQWKDIPVMVTYHPSYLLRQYNQQAKREAWEDLKTLLHFVYD